MVYFCYCLKTSDRYTQRKQKINMSNLDTGYMLTALNPSKEIKFFKKN